LENIVDPSATLAPSYQITNIELSSGQILNGIVMSRTDASWEIQTAQERLVVPADEIETSRDLGRSLMPDGLLDLLSADEVRDLFAYLSSPQQVSLSE
jgi:putative heme-binding domain-containing protein